MHSVVGNGLSRNKAKLLKDKYTIKRRRLANSFCGTAFFPCRGYGACILPYIQAKKPENSEKRYSSRRLFGSCTDGCSVSFLLHGACADNRD